MIDRFMEGKVLKAYGKEWVIIYQTFSDRERYGFAVVERGLPLTQPHPVQFISVPYKELWP